MKSLHALALGLMLLAAASSSHAQQGGAANPVGAGARSAQVVRIHQNIYQAEGFGNTFMVTTPEGNVIIDTSLAVNAPRHRELLRAISDAPIRYIVLTHGHADHTGGVSLWREEGTEVIAQANQREFLHYQHRLRGLFRRRNNAQYDGATRDDWSSEGVEKVENFGATLLATSTFESEYQLQLGGLDFQLLHTPGETYDHLTVWIPQYKAAFIGDNFYGSFPNLYTLRGTKPRWALDYVESINRVLELEPEILIPSHGSAIKGREDIQKALTRYRDAILYVHDETVKGMNLGRDVYSLMREIRLPKALELPEGYGSIAWTVRGIYEGYVGWFDENPATMYATPPSSVYGDLVTLAGGANTVAKSAADLLSQGEFVKALHMADVALVAEADNRAALAARLQALEALLERSKNSNESSWLRAGIRTTKSRMDPEP